MFELTLLASADSLEALSDALDALDALSVTVQDADAQTPQEHALFGEPGGEPLAQEGWQHSCVSALFATRKQAQDAQRVLGAQDFFATCKTISLSAVPEQDWVRLTQSQFEPVPITPDFWIVPSWHEVPAQARQFIRLDPGLAFGTGTHPTTRMCLRWIAHQATLGRVLDYGCGSGILAIAAAKWGASSVDAVDLDPVAVQATQANAHVNQVQVHAALPQLAAGLYQTVLANILASPLKVLAPLLCTHIAPQGCLVLAGILERQADELKAAYAAYVQLQVTDQEDGWILMTASKKS